MTQSRRAANRTWGVNDVPPARIFISYARGADPDQSVALEVAAALGQGHAVFVDPGLPHDGWAERLDSELRQAEAVILFLSAQSVHSELVAAELATAAQLAGARGGDRRSCRCAWPIGCPSRTPSAPTWRAAPGRSGRAPTTPHA